MTKPHLKLGPEGWRVFPEGRPSQDNAFMRTYLVIVGCTPREAWENWLAYRFVRQSQINHFAFSKRGAWRYCK